MQALDQRTFSEFLDQNGFHSPFLRWYLQYCCQDEYGAPPEKVSAWAGIHYFASRRGKAANCHENQFLVWPEGNGFLTEALAAPVRSCIRTEHVCYDIQVKANLVICQVFDARQNKTISYETETCVLSTPLFVSRYLLGELLSPSLTSFIKQLSYYPWVTANLVFSEIKPAFPAWDNVMYGNASLGLVYAQHQSLKQVQEKKTFTYYRNFSEKTAREERMALYNTQEEELRNMIIEDVKDFHNHPEDIESIEYQVLGHGMIAPNKGLSTSQELAILQEPIQRKIYLAHSDLSGYSVFEEAFFHGTRVASEILKLNFSTNHTV